MDRGEKRIPMRNLSEISINYNKHNTHSMPGRWFEMAFLVTFIAYVNIHPLTILKLRT